MARAGQKGAWHLGELGVVNPLLDSFGAPDRDHHVAGWVRNRSDGAVEAEFEGPAAAVERLVAWFRTGPPRARVDAVATLTAPTTGDLRFRIL